MGWDGSGNFNRTDGTRTGTQVWQDARDAGVKIVADDHDTHDEDIADGIENTVALDGQNTTTTDNAVLRYDSGNTSFEGVPISASELVGRSGSGDVRSLSAATVRSVIDALGATADKATSAQATAGSANNVYMTPARSTTFLHEQTGLSASAFSAIGNGAIVESGTNSNGSYVRWENGEQVCFDHNFSVTLDSTRTGGGTANTEGTDTWTFPAAFNTTTRSHGSSNAGANDGSCVLSCSSGTSNASVRLRNVYDEDNGSITINCSLVAWGFWK